MTYDDVTPLKVKGQRYNLLEQRMREAFKITKETKEMMAAKIFNEWTGNGDTSRLWQPTATKIQDKGQ